MEGKDQPQERAKNKADQKWRDCRNDIFGPGRHGKGQNKLNWIDPGRKYCQASGTSGSRNQDHLGSDSHHRMKSPPVCHSHEHRIVCACNRQFNWQRAEVRAPRRRWTTCTAQPRRKRCVRLFGEEALKKLPSVADFAISCD